MRGHRDLERASAAAIACAALSLAIPVEVLSLVFALPLALLLPGYAIAAAALPRRRLGAGHTLLLSLGLSLATLALGAVVLNYLGGLRPLPWALVLVAVVVGCCRAAALGRESQPRRVAPTTPRRLPGLLPTLMVTAGLVAAAGGVALAFQPVGAPHAVGYSELWLKDTANPGRVTIGVGNEEHEEIGYGLIVHFGDGATEQVRKLILKPGQTQLVSVPVEGRRGEGPVAVSAVLYRDGIPNRPYREVSGYVPARSTEP